MSYIRAPVYFPDDQLKGCILKVLPHQQWASAATRAFELNPANAPMVQMLAHGGTDDHISNKSLVLLTSRYWRSAGVHLTVSFLDNPPADLRDRILRHMNAWSEQANVAFVEKATGGQVRITRTANAGHWSYLGTDILSVPLDEPTMNLDSLTMSTSEEEFSRVVIHQTGHTLGFPHERVSKDIISRIDVDKAISYFNMTQDWSRDGTVDQILTPPDMSALAATAEVDSESVMCRWLPASIMIDRVDVTGGKAISLRDSKFARSLYPKMVNWEVLDINSASVSITVDGDQLYQLHNNGRIWKYTGPAIVGWQELDNNSSTKKIAAGGGHLYQLHKNGRIWKYNGVPLSGWDLIDTNSATIDIVADGDDLYQLHHTGRIWKYNGTPITGWDCLDNNSATVKIAASKGNLYQMHNNGVIWKYNGTPYTGWDCLDTNSATIDIVARDDELYQLHKTGLIWKYMGIPITGWQLLDNNSTTTAIVLGKERLYQIHKKGNIWKYVGVPISGWNQLDNNPESKAIAAGNSLYQIRTDGTILRYLGI